MNKKIMEYGVVVLLALGFVIYKTYDSKDQKQLNNFKPRKKKVAIKSSQVYEEEQYSEASPAEVSIDNISEEDLIRYSKKKKEIEKKARAADPAIALLYKLNALESKWNDLFVKDLVKTKIIDSDKHRNYLALRHNFKKEKGKIFTEMQKSKKGNMQALMSKTTQLKSAYREKLEDLLGERGYAKYLKSLKSFNADNSSNMPKGFEIVDF